MKEIINKEIVSKDKKIMILGLASIVIVNFLLTNTYSMFSSQGYPLEQEGLIKLYFSLSPLKTCILYFIYGIFIAFLFRSKNELFDEVDNGDYSLKEVFFTKYFTVISIVSLSTLIVTLVKAIAYLVNKNIFEGYSIGISNLIMFFLIYTVASIMISSVGFLFVFTVKNKFIALVLLPTIVYCLFLFFGLFKLLLSDSLWPIKWILDKVSTFLVDYFVLFITFDWRIELQPIGLQLASIFFYIGASLVLLALSYKAMKRIKGEVIEREFYFPWIKKLISIMISFIGAFTLLVCLDLVILLTVPGMFNKVNLGINILTFILMIVLYKIQNRNKLIKNEQA